MSDDDYAQKHAEELMPGPLPRPKELRDEFAMAALQGLCAKETHLVGMQQALKYEQIAKRAYLYADAMLWERDE